MRQLVEKADHPDGSADLALAGIGPVTPNDSPEKAKPSFWMMAFESLKRDPIFWIGVFALAIPSLYGVARHGWGTDQGAHAPIVFATGAWLIAINAKRAREVAKPGGLAITLIWLIPSLLLYAAATITGLTEVAALGAYSAAVAILFSNGGTAALKVLWYPLLYGLFLIPPPDSLVDTLTQPVKIATSEVVVSMLSMLSYPIAGSGVSIVIGQYELLVAAACAGLNSLISLTAIGTFYIYILHNANWRYMLVLMVAVLPIAILANFIRVVILVLLTYHAGEAAAQGFLHEFAGLFMFSVALLTIFGLDKLATPLRNYLEPREKLK